MDAMAEIRATFFEECAEQLAELHEALGSIANGHTDTETIGVAYRAVHSIKGGAASFQMAELSGFAKTFEALLGELRAGRAKADEGFCELAGRCARTLERLVALAAETGPLLAELKAMVALTDPEAGTETASPLVPDEGEAFDPGAFGFTPVSIDLSDLMGAETRWRIRFAPRSELYANANESARLLRDLLKLGEGSVTCDASQLPAFEDLDPEGAHLSWNVDLTASVDEAAIREVFEFAEWDCDLTVDAMASEAPEAEPAGEPDIAALLALARGQAPLEAGR